MSATVGGGGKRPRASLPTYTDRAAGRGRLDRHLRPRVAAVELHVVAEGRHIYKTTAAWVHELILSPLPGASAPIVKDGHKCVVT